MAGVEINVKGQIAALPFRVEKLRYSCSDLMEQLLSQAFRRATYSFCQYTALMQNGHPTGIHSWTWT